MNTEKSIHCLSNSHFTGCLATWYLRFISSAPLALSGFGRVPVVRSPEVNGFLLRTGLAPSFGAFVAKMEKVPIFSSCV